MLVCWPQRSYLTPVSLSNFSSLTGSKYSASQTWIALLKPFVEGSANRRCGVNLPGLHTTRELPGKCALTSALMSARATSVTSVQELAFDFSRLSVALASYRVSVRQTSAWLNASLRFPSRVGSPGGSAGSCPCGTAWDCNQPVRASCRAHK